LYELAAGFSEGEIEFYLSPAKFAGWQPCLSLLLPASFRVGVKPVWMSNVSSKVFPE